MSETQARSPKLCFLADSYLVYETRRDSLTALSAFRLPEVGVDAIGEPRRAAADSFFEARHTSRLLPTCAALLADLGNIRDRWRAPQDDGDS